MPCYQTLLEATDNPTEDLERNSAFMNHRQHSILNFVAIDLQILMHFPTIKRISLKDYVFQSQVGFNAIRQLSFYVLSTLTGYLLFLSSLTNCVLLFSHFNELDIDFINFNRLHLFYINLSRLSFVFFQLSLTVSCFISTCTDCLMCYIKLY